MHPIKYLIFYDADCGFCNYWVHFVLKHDTKKHIFFSALQSERGQIFLKERNLEASELDSFIFWELGTAYYKKSRAVFKLAQLLGGIFYLIGLFSFIPQFVTDYIYDFIAKNRYKLSSFTCRIPTEEEKKQFLD